MNALLRTGIVIAALMFAASALAIVLRPPLTNGISPSLAKLEERIPSSFGQWQAIESGALVINPQQTEVLDRIYSEVLNRSYRHIQGGQVVMLSIAYGSAQNKQSQVHRPDVCYPAQGFQIIQSKRAVIDTPVGSIPVRRLVAKSDKRVEPLTYWIKVGDRLAQGWVEQKYAVVLEGLSGRVSDGLIFRVSSIEDDAKKAFSDHDVFVAELLQTFKPKDKAFFIGASSSAQ